MPEVFEMIFEDYVSGFEGRGRVERIGGDVRRAMRLIKARSSADAAQLRDDDLDLRDLVS